MAKVANFFKRLQPAAPLLIRKGLGRYLPQQRLILIYLWKIGGLSSAFASLVSRVPCISSALTISPRNSRFHCGHLTWGTNINWEPNQKPCSENLPDLCQRFWESSHLLWGVNHTAAKSIAPILNGWYPWLTKCTAARFLEMTFLKPKVY